MCLVKNCGSISCYGIIIQKNSIHNINEQLNKSNITTNKFLQIDLNILEQYFIIVSLNLQ
jgi:hypothetical protein